MPSAVLSPGGGGPGRAISRPVKALAAILFTLLMLGASGARAANVDDTRAELAVLSGRRPESRLESGRFYTPALEREMPFFVYVPPGYDLDATARFPVLHMLHGLGGSNWEWAALGLLSAADELIEADELPPFLIVLPQGDQA